MSVAKPPKPYPTYPLFPHSRGYWCKKVDKKHLSFGRWEWPDRAAYEASWKAALTCYNEFKEAEAHGRTLEANPDQIDLRTLINAYLTRQHERMGSGDIRPVHFHDVKGALHRFRGEIGPDLTVAQLEESGGPLLKRWLDDLRRSYGWYAYNRNVAIVRAMFKWAEHPTDGVLGRPFRLLAMLVKQGEIHRRREVKDRINERGEHCFSPAELLAMLHAGGIHHMAMGLLGYFCAFGNTDCSELTFSAIDFEPDPSIGLPPGWAHVHFPRPKTEIERAAVIPPLVVEAIRASIAIRPKPAERRWDKLVFITRSGFPYTRRKVHRREDGIVEKVVGIDSVGLMHVRARERIGICAKHGPMLRTITDRCVYCDEALKPMRKLGFYTYRHTAITYASGSTSQDAIHLWEGHAIAGIRSRYVAHVELPKLKPIADALLARLNQTRSSVAATSLPAAEAIAQSA